MPKTPELNGLTERMNKTIVERVISTLSHAKLPKPYWAEAMMTVVYLINKSPLVPLDGNVPQRVGVVSWKRCLIQAFEGVWMPCIHTYRKRSDVKAGQQVQAMHFLGVLRR